MPPPSLSCSPTRYLVPQGRTWLQNFTSDHKTSGKQYGRSDSSSNIWVLLLQRPLRAEKQYQASLSSNVLKIQSL